MRAPLLRGPPHLRLLGRPRADPRPPAKRASRSASTAPRRSSPSSTSTGSRSRFEDAVAKAGAADAIGRPHIAKAAGAGPDLGPFFEEYLVPGAKAFVSRKWPTAEQAVELIHDAGGVAVVAHPYWDVKDPEQVRDLVESLVRDVGLDGIETFYPPHTAEQTKHCLELCEEFDLVADRLLGLPRPDAQDLQPLGRLRHLRPRRAAGARATLAERASGRVSAIGRGALYAGTAAGISSRSSRYVRICWADSSADCCSVSITSSGFSGGS